MNEYISKQNLKNKEKMTILKLLLMTLVPSLISTFLYITIGMFWQGIPSIILLFVLAIPTLFIFEMVTVLLANKKEYGKCGLQIVFSKCEKIKWWKIFIYAFILFIFAGIMSITIAPLEDMLMKGVSDNLYDLLPAYFDWTNFEFMKQYSKEVLIFTSIFYIITNVLICPITEEIYFRGYLTNLLERYGTIAPIIVSVAFSLYHWWLPFNNIFRICVFAVAFVITYKKKNIYISIVFHCLCNLFSSISFILALFN